MFSVKIDVVRPYSTPLANCERFVESLSRGDGQHGTEDLFFEDAHCRRDIVEDRRLDEVTFAEMIGLIAAENQARAFLPADVDVIEIGLPLLFVHCRPHVDGFIQAGADLDFLRRFDQPLD